MGSVQHVSGELFKIMTGISLVHVPYRGAAPALTDLISGQVQVMFDAVFFVNRVHQGRQTSCAGNDDSDTLGCDTGPPDH